jgi:hypothetical protein
LAASADVAQLVEHQLPKLRVAGSIPVVRFGSPTLFREGPVFWPLSHTVWSEMWSHFQAFPSRRADLIYD